MRHDSRTSIRILLILAAVATIMSIACYDENPVSSDDFLDDFEPPIILDVDPENGSGGVDRGSQIIIQFNMSMDTASVSGNLHVTGDTGMRQWMDSVLHMRGGGNGSGCDDSCMMKWLDSISYDGTITWTTNLDSCIFQPDSLMLGNAEHTVFLSGSIYAITGARMVVDTMEYGGFVSYFQTGL